MNDPCHRDEREKKNEPSTSEDHLPEKIEASLKMSERREVTGS